MKKFIKDFFLNEIVLITFLLLFSLVVYFFYSNFNLVFLLWLIQSGIIIFFKYRSSNSIISKTKLDKVFIYFIRFLFLFVETLCCFEIFVIFFVISYKFFYKNYELILGLSFALFLISMVVLSYFYEKYQKEHEDKDKPKVLILMGLPGSYIIAAENSYVGSLVELAGGENVYAGTDQEFLNVNTEDMKTKEPDLILRTSHALPDQVKEMFQKDFETNDIWKHFQAVEEGRVYDLTYGLFGMSATFDYPQALEELQTLLYPDENGENGQTDTEKTAEETSEKEK